MSPRAGAPLLVQSGALALVALYVSIREVSAVVSTRDAFLIGFLTLVNVLSLLGWHFWFARRDRRKGVTKAEVDPDAELFVRIYRAVILLGYLALPVGVILLLPNVLAALLLGLGWVVLVCALPYAFRALLARRKGAG